VRRYTHTLPGELERPAICSTSSWQSGPLQRGGYADECGMVRSLGTALPGQLGSAPAFAARNGPSSKPARRRSPAVG